VTIAKVAQRDVPVEIQVVGNVAAYSTITVKSQVTGQLNSVRFREGDFVSAGVLLFALDRRPIEAQIRQAEATLAKNFAQAKQAEANLAKDQAQQKYLRAQSEQYTKLTQEGIISKDQDDLVQANFGAINQAIEADRAAIESARADAGATRADIENLKVQLSYTEIRSPISGRTGNLNVTKGNLGYGAGGEARQPLGLAVVGGLLFSQLVTLHLTPVFYTYLASAQKAWSARHSAGKIAANPAAES
jgi:multidrug efflux system membrane fusion protein